MHAVKAVHKNSDSYDSALKFISSCRHFQIKCDNLVLSKYGLNVLKNRFGNEKNLH